METDRRQSLGAIAVHLEQIARVHADVRDETRRLAKALETPPGTYGSWAEQQLQSVLEMAGMAAHIDQQRSTEPAGSERLRPSAILRLPGDRRLAIDANLPNASFRAVVDASDEEAEAQALADHARTVRQHMERLAAPEYWAGLTPVPEFVVLYFSGESPFEAAMQSDPDLFGDAVRQRILLATPTTLIALAKAIAHSWSEGTSVANAREVMAFGSELYEKVMTLSGQVDELGRSLDSNVRTYNSLASEMQTVVLPNVRRFRDMAPELAKGEPPSSEPTSSEPVDLAVRSAQRRRSFVLTQGGQDATISIVAGPTSAEVPKAPQGIQPASTNEPELRRTISSIEPF